MHHAGYKKQVHGSGFSKLATWYKQDLENVLNCPDRIYKNVSWSMQDLENVLHGPCRI